MGPRTTSAAGSAKNAGEQSQLILELTDPPVVPLGTTSLNLTYSAINLEVSLPNQNSPQIISIVPGAEFDTVNLLSLGNASQTLGLSTLKSGSQVFSVTFLVSKIEIEINQSKYFVSLATGGNTLPVLLNSPQTISSNREALLLQFNPAIIQSVSGYQLIPSSLGIVKPANEVSPADAKIGNVQTLTRADHDEIRDAKGHISANLEEISVAGNMTTMSVQDINDGKNPERLVLFGINGDFSSNCPAISDHDSDHDWKVYCRDTIHHIVLIPGEPHVVSTDTTVSSCAPRHTSLVNSQDIANDISDPIVMNPGQCLMFNFTGVLSVGEHVVTPLMKQDERFNIHVFGANGADSKLECVLQSYSSSLSAKCSTENDDGGD